MSLEELAFLSQIVVAVAIVPSLIFVGVQMHQNTRAVRAAASQAYAATRAQLNSNVTTVGEFARIWRRGVAEPDTLTDDEHVRFLVHMTTLFLNYEAANTQWRHGQLDKEHWDCANPGHGLYDRQWLHAIDPPKAAATVPGS